MSKNHSEDLQIIDPDFQQPEKDLVRFEVHGRPAFAAVTVHMEEGQKILADGGALLWMDGDVHFKTFCPGGCTGGCARSCAGESCCMNRLTGPGYATFSFNTPGDLLPFAVTPDHGWILSQGAFVASTDNCKVSARFAGCCAAGLSGEGLFLTKVTTTDPYGILFAGGYGEIIRHDIPAGKTLWVDNGLFFAAHCKTKISITIMGGLKTCCCGGEGLVMALTGPATVYTQSRDPALWESMDQPQNQDQQQQV